MIRRWLLCVALLTCAVSPSVAGELGDNCPLVNKTYNAALVEREVTGAVGEEILLEFTLDPPEPPPGFFVTVNAKVLETPESASIRDLDILTGFPETSITAHAPGRWAVEVVVSLMAKGSCGGLSAATVLRDSAILTVLPAEEPR